MVFMLTPASYGGTSPAANNAFNTTKQFIRNRANMGQSITAHNGVKLANLNYYTAFGISYPEGSYGGAAAARHGITPGYNVTSGTKVYDCSRDLNMFVFDEATDSWVPDSYFTGERINGHCYDTYDGEPDQHAKFQADYDNIKANFPEATFIIIGSHAAERNDDNTQTRIRLQELGLPDSQLGVSRPEYILVAKPGQTFVYAYENYDVNPSQVAHAVFPLPITKRPKDTYFEFDGSNDYIEVGSDGLSTNGSYTLSAWLKPNGASWGDNAIPLYNTYHDGAGNFGIWHHFGHDNILRWRHRGTSYTYGNLSGIGLVADTWQLTTITWDGTTLRLYKNGVQTNSTTSPGHFTRSNGSPRVGRIARRDTGNVYHWNGGISNHQVFNRALSAAEVLENFNMIKGRFGL